MGLQQIAFKLSHMLNFLALFSLVIFLTFQYTAYELPIAALPTKIHSTAGDYLIFTFKGLFTLLDGIKKTGRRGKCENNSQQNKIITYSWVLVWEDWEILSSLNQRGQRLLAYL